MLLFLNDLFPATQQWADAMKVRCPSQSYVEKIMSSLSLVPDHVFITLFRKIIQLMIVFLFPEYLIILEPILIYEYYPSFENLINFIAHF